MQAVKPTYSSTGYMTPTSPLPSTNLTFKGLPKYAPDVFDLRPDFNQNLQQQAQQDRNANLRPGGGLDFWA
jgi:hypothetical protein